MMDNWIIIAELLGKWINVNFCNRLALIDFDVSLSYPISTPYHNNNTTALSYFSLYLYMNTLLDYAQDENIHFKCNHHFQAFVMEGSSLFLYSKLALKLIVFA